MLSSLKERLLNVKKNVNIFNNEDKQNKCNRNINEYAGAEILNKFQEDWVAIHDLNEHNAKKAEEIANTIDKISMHIQNDKENIGLITHMLTQSNLKSNISNCLTRIKDLYSTCESIEKGLITLENLIEEEHLENMKKQHSYHLQQYEVRKQESLDSFKSNLEENYKKKVIEHEISKKKVLEERQKVFQEAFKTDLEIYKNLGTIPKVDLPKKPSALLEEIQLDYDQNELDQFFSESS